MAVHCPGLWGRLTAVRNSSPAYARLIQMPKMQRWREGLGLRLEFAGIRCLEFVVQSVAQG